MISANRKAKYRTYLDGTQSKPGKFFDWILVGLIAYSVVTLTIDTLPGNSPGLTRFLHISEVVITLIFTLEYAVRIYLAPNRWRYIFSFWGIIDLVAVAPFYIMLGFGIAGVDLRGVRAFRLLRILWLLKLARYSRTLARFRRAFELAREELLVYLLMTLILLFVSATGIYYFENPAQPEAFASIPHSLWWAIVTLTTVGYGDVYPITAGGRFFTFFVLMVGLGIVAVPTGLVSSALSQARREESDIRLAELEAEGKGDG
ncbi:ion transporter [Marinobacterium lutimaris]|uniref:Voltage-gated potassium channel n=1 Tax=Marinobacterium lutimaris TaxID=568106 RepID=A0A1H5X4T9_9GAMM|nr:ion transporter [Marinobacterium lutimaris]SEG06455.1 voltage-gated potassium channel [Marinobacterium lutimaris]